METTEVISYLMSGGPFGVAAVFFLYKWQQAENKLEATREATDIKTEANFKAMIELQEKRIVEGVRIEGVLQSNTAILGSQTQLLQAIVSQRGSP